MNANTVFIFISIIFSVEALADKLSDIEFMTEEYAPFNYTEDGKVIGLGVDILVEVFRELKLKKTRGDIRVLPWARSYKMVQKTGEKNVLFMMARTDQRENIFKWVGPVPGNIYAIFTKKSPKKITSLNEIKDKTGVAIREDVAGQSLLALGYPSENMAYVAKPKQLFSMVKSGRVDFFVYGAIGLAETMKTSGFDRKDFTMAYKVKESKLYYAFNKSVDDGVVKSYQAAFDRVIENEGFLQKVKNKYLFGRASSP